MQIRIYQMTGNLKSFAAALLALLALATGAHATNYYWDTLITDLWANGANWATDPTGDSGTGIAPGSGDSAFFNGSNHYGSTIVQLNADTSIAGITFNNTGTTLIQSDSGTTRTLTLYNSGMSMASTAGAVTIGSASNPVSILFPNNTTLETWKNNSTTQALTIIGNISSLAAAKATTTSNGFAASGVSTASFPDAPGVILKNGTGFSRMLGNTGIIDGGGKLTLDNYSLTIGNTDDRTNNGIGASGTGNNTLTLINGSYFESKSGDFTALGGAAFTVGGSTSGNQVLNVLSGSTLIANRRFNVAVNITNKVNVDGAGSTFTQRGQINNTSGGTWKISNGGTANLLGTLTQIHNSNNFAMSVTGTDPTTGAAAVVVTPSLTLPNAGNTITVGTVGGVGSGGFLQFTGAAPAISLTGSVTINNGGLSYGFLPSFVATPAAYSGDLLGSNQGGAGTTGAFTWLGNNRLRLNGGTTGVSDNGTTDYTFANNAGAKNYYAMEFLGTSSITGRNITFDAANGGELLFNGATASVTNSTKFQGGQVTVKADTAASTFTGVISDGGSSGGLTLTSSTATSASKLTLASANLYSGATIINCGTLALGADGSINSSSGISIAGGATFDVSAVSGYALAQTLSAKGTGTATVNGAMDASGRTLDMQDGTNLGILALNNNVVLNSSTLKFDLGISMADVIHALGGVSLTGTQTVNVAALSGAASLATGTHAYTLITAPGGGLDYTKFSLANSSLTVNSTTYNLVLSGDSTHTYLDVSTGGGTPTIHHYDVSTVALQTAGSAFTVTVTAKDSGGNTVADSSTVVTLTGTGGVVFDSNGDGTFGDNTKTLASGTFTISAKTNTAGSVILTATDITPKTGDSSTITVQSQFAAHMGGQSGVPTGQEGFNADANSDGVANGLAWILGGAAMSNSIALLPQVTLDAGYLKLFNFKALKADKRLGTTLSVQYSSDLGSWHSAIVPSAYGVNTVSDVRFTVTDNNDDYDIIIAEIPQSKALGGGKLFGRLDAIGQ